jgi:hypothetical protein
MIVTPFPQIIPPRDLDPNTSHFLSIEAASDLTANRTLEVETGDMDRQLTFTGDAHAYVGEPVATKTANYSMTLTDRVILADATGGPFVIVLPPVAPSIGMIYYIKRINLGPNNVTVEAA